jgi:hypothetical protein
MQTPCRKPEVAQGLCACTPKSVSLCRPAVGAPVEVASVCGDASNVGNQPGPEHGLTSSTTPLPILPLMQCPSIGGGWRCDQTVGVCLSNRLAGPPLGCATC